MLGAGNGTHRSLHNQFARWFYGSYLKIDDFLFKIKIINFINRNWLVGWFDRLTGQFFIQNLNTKF
jgi:hypothetical protein